MAFEHRDGSGSLFRNDRRETDKQPEYKGEAVINGEKFWISAWVKEGAKGKFFSLAFKPKDEKPKQQETYKSEPLPEEDVPF